jgi:hypothetical protein
MSDNRQISEMYAKIGAELIETEDALIDVRNSQATIVYLSSDCEKTDKGRLVYGQCERIADKYKWGIPADFTITLFQPNIEGKSAEAIRRIILHELLHVGIDVGNDGEEKYSVKPHDFEDFRLLVERWGVDWAEVGGEPLFEADIEEWKEVRKG